MVEVVEILLAGCAAPSNGVCLRLRLRLRLRLCLRLRLRLRLLLRLCHRCRGESASTQVFIPLVPWIVSIDPTAFVNSVVVMTIVSRSCGLQLYHASLTSCS
jgi:hypothetical protein